MSTLLSEKYLIVIFSALFLVSASFLFWQNTSELTPQIEKNLWILSFTEPENQKSLAFTVENWTKGSAFEYDISYEVTLDKIVTLHESFLLEPGETTTITPGIALPTESTIATLTVTHGQEKKSLSRK